MGNISVAVKAIGIEESVARVIEKINSPKKHNPTKK